MFTDSQIELLAKLAAADYAANCKGPTIRGLNGEKELRGESYKEISERTGLSIEEVMHKTLDLSQASFDELSDHWKGVNIKSAQDMVSMIYAVGGTQTILDTLKNLWALASMIHEAWLDNPNNSWAKGGNLDKPFDKLDPSEQMKDIQMLVSMFKWLLALE